MPVTVVRWGSRPTTAGATTPVSRTHFWFAFDPDGSDADETRDSLRSSAASAQHEEVLAGRVVPDRVHRRLEVSPLPAGSTAGAAGDRQQAQHDGSHDRCQPGASGHGPRVPSGPRPEEPRPPLRATATGTD